MNQRSEYVQIGRRTVFAVAGEGNTLTLLDLVIDCELRVLDPLFVIVVPIDQRDDAQSIFHRRVEIFGQLPDHKLAFGVGEAIAEAARCSSRTDRDD